MTTGHQCNRATRSWDSWWDVIYYAVLNKGTSGFNDSSLSVEPTLQYCSVSEVKKANLERSPDWWLVPAYLCQHRLELSWWLMSLIQRCHLGIQTLVIPLVGCAGTQWDTVSCSQCFWLLFLALVTIVLPWLSLSYKWLTTWLITLSENWLNESGGVLIKYSARLSWAARRLCILVVITLSVKPWPHTILSNPVWLTKMAENRGPSLEQHQCDVDIISLSA